MIDELGLVDEVKNARKCSKANVLGESCGVYSKREHQLWAEQAGLKLLIGGHVGGPALVEKWEWEWKMKLELRKQWDEVEGEGEDGDDEDSDDEEGEEEEEETCQFPTRLGRTTTTRIWAMF